MPVHERRALRRRRRGRRTVPSTPRPRALERRACAAGAASAAPFAESWPSVTSWRRAPTAKRARDDDADDRERDHPADERPVDGACPPTRRVLAALKYVGRVRVSCASVGCPGNWTSVSCCTGSKRTSGTAVGQLVPPYGEEAVVPVARGDADADDALGPRRFGRAAACRRRRRRTRGRSWATSAPRPRSRGIGPRAATPRP